MPGHVRASINWNTLKRMNGDKYSQEIVDGMKVIVCKLKQNPLGFTSVAYPTDELRMPEWFKELPAHGCCGDKQPKKYGSPFFLSKLHF